MAATVKVAFPEKAGFLFASAPYKVIHGGRGSSKSWSVARALLILGARKKLFILCAREVQKSIRDSVHKLLSEQIPELGLAGFYTVQEAKIIGANGTEFVFEGVRNNITEIKSMEGVDICWVEEATFVTHSSWEILLPTIRRDAPHGPFGKGSEVWITFNPELATDETYKRWVANPVSGTEVVEMNWRDNPFFPDTLRRQMIELRDRDYDSYLTVWEGKTRKVLDGAIYAKELRKAIEEGRVSPHVKYDRSKGVTVVFDLGRADMTSLWFMQQIGMEHHAIDFYENNGFDFSHYLEVIQQRKYLVNALWLPHDAEAETVAAKKSIKRQAQDAYPDDGRVRIVPRVAETIKINSLRQLFPRMHFNEVACADGIQCLTHYRYDVDKDDPKKRSVRPVHDWASHASDSLAYYAVMLREGSKKPAAQGVSHASQYEHAQGWMG